MHHNLALVKAFQTSSQAVTNETPHVSEMDIILFQALLMEAGSATFKAMKSGELEGILAGVIALAYTSLQAFAAQDKELGENQDGFHQEYQLCPIMRQLSDKIQHCSSGQAEHYAELYHLCAYLTSSFLNADFDKAFQAYHEWHGTYKDKAGETAKMPGLIKVKPLGLIDCFYE
jgi:hypothetical protein